jgi:hypothetical protein
MNALPVSVAQVGTMSATIRPSSKGASDAPAFHAEASKQASPTASSPAQQSVETYPASFFAAAQPVTANDMIARLPGFVFDDGGNVRGYAGAGRAGQRGT